MTAIRIALFFAASTLAFADNWPQWRGPDGDGTCKEKGLPLKWSRTQKVKWRVALPGSGNSTPIVWGSRVFLTQPEPKNGKRKLLCLDRKTGGTLWEQSAESSGPEETHGTNPYCSASAVTDGERVIAWFGSAGLVCYTVEGKPIWQRDLGQQAHIWGYGSSPVLHGDLCLLNFGPGERQFLIAVNKRTGETVWQHDEPGGAKGDKEGKWIGSWSTPLVAGSKTGPEVLLSLPNRIAAFDPATGKERWTCAGLTKLVYASPIVADGIAVAMSGYNGSALAVRLGGEGDVTGSHRLWVHEKEKQRIGSAAIYQGHIYILNDPGIAECIELKTGRVVYSERIEGGKAGAQSWSSMVLSEDRLYALTKAGDAVILRASPKFEVLAINSMGEPTNSSVAVSDGELFLRTHQALWCIAETEDAAKKSDSPKP